MALEAFKKFYHLQTCTPSMLDGAPGMSSLLCASASMHLLAVSMIFAGRGAESAGQGEGGLHRILEMDKPWISQGHASRLREVNVGEPVAKRVDSRLL